MHMEGQPWTCISRLCMLMLVWMWVVDGDAEGIPKVWKEKMGSSTMPAFLKARVNRGMSPQLIHKFMEDIDTASLSSKSFCEAALTLCHSQEDDGASSNYSLPETYFRSCDVVAGQDLSFESVKEALPFRPFLPHQLAQKLPLARHSLPPLLDMLNISSLSGLALGMKQTVSTCEQATAKGSIHKCVKSLEEMVHFVAEHLRDGERKKKRTEVLQPTLLPQGQNLTVRGVQLKGPSRPHKAIVCTDSLFPYLVFDCRVVQKALRNVEVKLQQKENAEVHTAIMQCWRPSLSFEEIGRPLRDTQLCQWMSVKDVVFVGGKEDVGVEEMAEENEKAEQDEDEDKDDTNEV